MTKVISVVGLGHVGLAIALGFASKGYTVIGIDNDKEKIERLGSGKPLVYEEGPDEAIKKVKIITTWDYKEILKSDVTFVCVATPSDSEGAISLGDLRESVEKIAEVLKEKEDYHVMVIKSSVVPGTTGEVILPILRKTENFGLCVNPEFLRQGRALHDFLYPDRIIIGEYDKRSGDTVYDLYEGFDCPILRTDLKTAEMIKYASNAFLATKVSFINEIGNICKKLGIDVYEVAKGMGYDKRISDKFLNAGIGFGGPCLPKDLRALVARSKEIGYGPRILEEVLRLNDEQPFRMIELLKKHISLDGKTIGVLGLAFKPDTDSVTGSKAITVVEALLQEGARVKAYDPKAMPNFRKLFPQIEYVDREQVLKSDAILILTEWEEFNDLDYDGIVIDGRRISKARQARTYEGVGW